MGRSREMAEKWRAETCERGEKARIIRAHGGVSENEGQKHRSPSIVRGWGLVI